MTRMALGVVCVLAACVSAPAVQPAVWSHGTEADFAAGKLDKTVLTSLGEVTLAREVETLLAPDAKLGMISAVAVDGKDVYVASAPGGKIYRVAKGKAVEFAELPATLVRPLIADKDGLLAGVSGKKAGLYRVDAKGEVAPLWTDEAVTFVWAVVPDGDGGWYVATGSEGKVYHVRRGAGEVIYDSDDENVLSLVADADGLYAGTGENGLVVRIDPARKTSRIAYDAPEKEISCLLAAPDGSVYAATSDSSRSSATGEKPSAKDGGAPTTPAPAKGAPKPPAAKTAATAPAAGPKAPGRVLIITRKPAPRPASGPTPPRPTASGGGKGNAVYHIDAEGFVRTVFRRPVSLWAMALSGDGLILATGHGGELFRVDPAADRTSMIAKLDPKDITAMAADADGRLILGAADTAGVYALATGQARAGTLVSAALDAKQIARWGTLDVRADVPAWCSATIATRSGNVAKPDEKTWSDWSRELPVGKGWRKIASEPGRFLQYRLTLKGTGKVSPVVESVRVVYQVGNLAPDVRAVKITPSAGPKPRPNAEPGPKPFRMIEAAAADPNGDPLTFRYDYRRAGDELWIELADEEGGPKHPWDTTGMPDGVYEVRVTADDGKANPPGQALSDARIFKPVVIDNNGPAVSDVKAKRDRKSVTVTAKVADTTSRIVRIDYSVDSDTKWVSVLPADGICDDLTESISFQVDDLPAGAHRIAIRATDAHRNTGYGSVEIKVKG